MVTAWNYCYYNDSVSDSEVNYTATVAVWRNETSQSQLIVVGNSVKVVTLQPAYTIAKIFCKKAVLEPMEYFNIRTGDMVGVVLPSINPIPLMGRFSDFAVMRSDIPLNSPYNLSLSNLMAEQLAMHLYINIGKSYKSAKFFHLK